MAEREKKFLKAFTLNLKKGSKRIRRQLSSYNIKRMIEREREREHTIKTISKRIYGIL